MTDTQTPEYRQIIQRLKELKPYHINPYNLGDEREISNLLDKLFAFEAQASIPSAAEKFDSIEDVLTPLIDKIGYDYRNMKYTETGFAKDMLDVAEAGMEIYARQFKNYNRRYASPTKAEESKEEVMAVISSNLYNIRNDKGHPMLDTGKCDEIAEFIYNDIKDKYASQFASASFSLEVVEKAWDAAELWYSETLNNMGMIPPDAPSKEQFLTSIKTTTNDK